MNQNPQVIKVAIADDHTLFRAGVRTHLLPYKNIDVIAEAENGMKLLSSLRSKPVDVVLLDIQMPIMDGLATLPALKELHPEAKVIMLSMHNDLSVASKMEEIGADAYLTKESDAKVIYDAICKVHEGDSFFSNLSDKDILTENHIQTSTNTSVLPVVLSEKEITVLRLICEEKSTKEIADYVDLSPRTVEAIRDKLKTKIGTKSTAGLVMYAVRAGMVGYLLNQ